MYVSPLGFARGPFSAFEQQVLMSRKRTGQWPANPRAATRDNRELDTWFWALCKRSRIDVTFEGGGDGGLVVVYSGEVSQLFGPRKVEERRLLVVPSP